LFPELLVKSGGRQDCSRVARFVLIQNTKAGKNIPNYHTIYQMAITYIYQMGTKYTKWAQNIPNDHTIYLQNDHTIYQMAIKYIY
jgi:hypothetical protein